MPKKKLTPNQAEFKKELRRINRFIKAAEARGFRFDKAIIPEMPTRVTKKRLDKIKELTPDVLYESSTYLDPSTGKVVTGAEGRKIERRRAAIKGATRRAQKARTGPAREYKPPHASTVVLDNLLDMIEKWEPLSLWSRGFAEIKRQDKDILHRILQGAIDKDGRDTVAARVEAQAERVMDLAHDILYGGSGKDKDYGINVKMIQIAEIIRNGALTPEDQEEIMEG